MEFRWIALITLWTLIAGPMFDSPSNPQPSQSRTSASPTMAKKAK